MKRILLALAAMCCSHLAHAQAAPSCSLGGWTANAGAHEHWSVSCTAAETLSFHTVNGTALAGTDYDATTTVVSIPAGGSTAVLVATHANAGDYGKTLNFGAVITLNNKVLASAGAAIVEPAPPAPPAQTSATGPSDTISGLAPIASEFDYHLGMQPAWGTGAIPVSAAPDVVGAFRFICGMAQLVYDDPIVYPGQPGVSHLHQVYGNTGVSAYSTYQSLRTSGQSTCANGAYPLNRSGYWAPAMLDGKGNVVQADYAVIYYKRRPLSDPKCSLTSGDPQAEGNCVPIPNGIEFTFGWSPATPTAAKTGNGFFICADASGANASAHYPDIASLAASGLCTPGRVLLAELDAPSCWDGTNLDSADHRSHVGYPSYGYWGYLKCDAAHPYVIPTFHLATSYSIALGDDVSLWQLSSDAMAPGEPHGWTLHGDYFGAWDNNALAAWTQGCIDRLDNCSGGDLGNGEQLIGAQKPAYGWVNPAHLVPIPVRP